MNSFLDPVEFSLASKGLRFANYLIDIILFRILTYSFGYLLGSLFVSSMMIQNDMIFIVFTLFLELLLFILYFSLQELVFKGRTIGKFITGTKVVTLDGQEPDFTSCIIRALSRCVPFEPFSFFGEVGWHDAWSKTRVVNAKEFEINHSKFNAIDQIGANS